MGKIIRLEGRILIPTQNCIYPRDQTINKAFWSCYQNKIEDIPIFPVRQNPQNDNELLVLDGHHRAIIYDLFGIKDFDIWLAEYEKDSIQNINDLNWMIKETMDKNILKRWYWAVSEDRKDLYPKTFRELRGKHEELKDIDTAKKYFENLKL